MGLKVSAIKGPEYRSKVVTLAGGTSVKLRAIGPEDESALTAFYGRLSPETIYQRFFMLMAQLPPDWAHALVSVDHDRRMAIVAVDRNNQLIAVARYDCNEQSDEAEVAIVIQDAWQGKGLGTILMNELLSYAESKRIYRFRAYVLADNHRMLHLLDQGTKVLDRKIDHGIVSLLLARRPRIEIGAA